MNIQDFATVLPIVVICHAIGQGLKAFKYINDVCIPFLLAVCGGILGAIALYVMPSYPAEDVITAIAIGVFSGLASTGSNQVYKQLNKFYKGE